MKPWSSGHTGNGLQGMCCAGLNSSVASDSLWPKGLQPARLLCSWGFSRQEYWSGLPLPSPFYGWEIFNCINMLLLCCAYLLSHVWLFATPWTIACQAPLFMGILQVTILEWVAMPSSRGSSQPRGQTQVSRIAGEFLTVWSTREAHVYYSG